MQHEAYDVRIRRPIGLDRCEPLGEQPNRRLRRVNVASQDAIDWRQAETASKGIDGSCQNPIDPQPVHEPEQGLLQEPWHIRIYRNASQTSSIYQAANHRRLQVYRGEPQAKFLLRQSGAKAQPGCRYHGIRGLSLADNVVERRNVRKNRSLRNAIK